MDVLVNVDLVELVDTYSGELVALVCFIAGFILFTSYNRVNRPDVPAPELLDYDGMIVGSIGEGKLDKALGLFDEQKDVG
jgi:hypothetical protein